MLAEAALAATSEAQGTALLPTAGASAAWEPAAPAGTQAGLPGTPSSSSVRSFGELSDWHCLAVLYIAIFSQSSRYEGSFVKNLAATALAIVAQLPCKHVL